MRGTDVTIPPDGEVLPSLVLQRIVTSAADVDNPVFTGITRGSVAIGITALGNSAASAYPIATQVVSFSSVPAGTGGVLPLLDPYGVNYTGALIVIQNADPSANTLALYPPPGASINNGSAGASVSIPAGIAVAQCLSVSNWVVSTLGGASVAPQQLLANTGTVFGSPSGLAISNDLTIIQGATPELAIGATIARSASTLPASATSADFAITSGTLTAQPSLARTAQTLALNNTGTVAQVVQGPVTHSGSVQVSEGVYYSGSYNWVGGPNVNQSNRQNFGYNGSVNIGGTVTAASATIFSGTYNSTTGLVTLTLSNTINVLSDTFVTVSGVTGTGSFAVLDGNQITEAGTSGTVLTFAVGTGLTMTITGGNVAQDITGANLFEEVIVDNWNAAPGGNGNIWTVTHIAASGVVGGRQTVTQNLNVSAPTGNATVGSANYVTTTINAGASGNDGGTALASHGGLWSLVTTMYLGSTCTYWGAGVGYEMDINVGTGASVSALFGLHVCTTAGHAVNGSLDDIAIHISGAGSAQSAYWKVGFGLGAATKLTAFGPASTFIKAYPDVGTGTLTVANGIDLSNGGAVTITGNAWVSNGATISGAGNAAVASMFVPGRIATIAAQTTITSTDAGRDVFINTGTTAYLASGVQAGFFAHIWDGANVASPTSPLAVLTTTGTVCLFETPGGHARVVSQNGTIWRYSP